MSGIARWVLPTAVAGALAFTTPSFGDDLGGAEVDLGNTSTEAQAAEQSDAAMRAATDGDSKSLISISDVQPILQPVSDYTGKFTERTTVTGDWGGWRQKLYDSGVALNASVTQVFGVVGAGGEKTGDTGYNALFDYGLTLDSARLGLWPGGLVVVNAQSAVAAGLPLRDGALSPSDYNVVFPNFDRPTTELMEYYVIQGLGDTLGLMLGRVNPVVWDRNRFSFDPRTQFLNGAISQQLLVGGLVSFSTYTASLMWEANKYLTILGGVYDPVVRPGEYAPFKDWGLYTVIELNSTHGGVLNLVGVYSDAETTAFDNPRLVLDELLGIDAPTKPNNWMFGLNFEQYIWKPSYAENTTAGTLGLDYSTSAFGFQEPGLGVFGRVEILPKSRNPFNTSVSLGIGGRGIIPGRPFDRMGFAGYWLNDSDELGGLLGALLEDEWGLEMFYNYAITPAIQASADFQYIDSSVRTSDDVFIFGLRLFLQL